MNPRAQVSVSNIVHPYYLLPTEQKMRKSHLCAALHPLYEQNIMQIIVGR